MIKSSMKVYSSEDRSDMLLQFSIPKDGSAGDCFVAGSNEAESRCILRLSEEGARALALDILNHLADRSIRKVQ